MHFTTFLAVLGASSTGALARSFTVTNNCPYTVWPAIFTDLTVGTATPDHRNGWEAASHSSVSFSVPNNWKSGRIWGRRDCNFGSNSGPTSCVSGGCNGGLVCDPHNGTGVPPATLAEFTLSPNTSAPDNYDVSVVDGYNIPLRISPSAGCPTADCPADLNPNCPAQLVGPKDSSGTVLGCQSACEAGLAPDPNNSPNCCTGSHNTSATCPSSGVQYYSYFKSRCPNSYTYAYDESSGTALWKCPNQADYTVTFCP
ncbi:thaumatin-like protein [Dentipellis sp. KUC8613]|nr:thaumatin-like protein [Dentipellis sp. KUC8613]